MERVCKECIFFGFFVIKKNNDFGVRNKKSKVCIDNIEKFFLFEIKLKKVYLSKLIYLLVVIIWNGIWWKFINFRYLFG